MPVLVSIIMPSYNAEQYIEQAICSVQAQTYQEWELWVIDDASQDGTVDCVQTLAQKELRIHLVKLYENQGPAVARNVGIEKAQGRYIAFLDCDDWWPQDKLQKQLGFMKAQQSALSYGGFAKTTEQGETTAQYRPHTITTYRDMLKRAGFNLCTVMYDVEQVGKRYMESGAISEDYTILLDILKQGVTAQGMPEVLAFYRTRARSVSANKHQSANVRWQILRQRECLPLLDSLWCFFCYTMDGIRKYCLRWSF